MDNDFHQTFDIFKIFESLEVKNMDEPATAESLTNGHGPDVRHLVNGEHKAAVNGASKEVLN